jgi:hypothetical protein
MVRAAEPHVVSGVELLVVSIVQLPTVSPSTSFRINALEQPFLYPFVNP